MIRRAVRCAAVGKNTVDCSKSGLEVLTPFKLCEKWGRAAKQPDAAHILQWDHVTPLGSTATISLICQLIMPSMAISGLLTTYIFTPSFLSLNNTNSIFKKALSYRTSLL